MKKRKIQKVYVRFSPMWAIVPENQVEKLCDALEKTLNKFTSSWEFQNETDDVDDTE